MNLFIFFFCFILNKLCAPLLAVEKKRIQLIKLATPLIYSHEEFLFRNVAILAIHKNGMKALWME